MIKTSDALAVLKSDYAPAPFPWFGGKRKVAGEVWRRFGNVRNYVEPFFGSGAVLLQRPEGFSGNETINDLDGYVANFWRAIKHDPEDVAEYAHNPVNENDLHARHIWLLQQQETLQASLDGDPFFYDAQIAGYWVWGICCWIGSGFCSGKGPWWVNENRQLVHLGDSGRGVNRQLVHLGNNGQGVNRKRVHLGDSGQGVNRKRVHLGDSGQGVNRKIDLISWFQSLADRLARVRVCSGDWSRVCSPSVTFKHGLTGVFLDPPYADTAKRQSNLYRKDSESVAHAVRKWAIENGENIKLRIALCGYDGEHEMPRSWRVCAWSAGKGYGAQAKQRTGNGNRERIWFSPSCEMPSEEILLDRGSDIENIGSEPKLRSPQVDTEELKNKVAQFAHKKGEPVVSKEDVLKNLEGTLSKQILASLTLQEALEVFTAILEMDEVQALSRADKYITIGELTRQPRKPRVDKGVARGPRDAVGDEDESEDRNESENAA
jgi:DNA adenine methylase